MSPKIYLAAIALCIASTDAAALFAGDYAPGNWQTTEPGPTDPLDVDIIGEAFFDGDETLIITSPDASGDCENCDVPPYIFAHTVMVQADAYLTFDWHFETLDESPFWDRLGVWRNGEFFQLIDAFAGDFGEPGEGEGPFGALVDGNPNEQAGSAGMNVQVGDEFGLGLISEDSCCGPSTSMIFNFAVNPYGSGSDGPFQPQFIPIPAAIWLLAPALVAVARVRRA